MTPESALPDASPRSLLLNQMNEGQQEAQKHQQSDSPNEQSGTEIMITNRSRQGVSLPETVVRCVEFAIRSGISGSQCWALATLACMLGQIGLPGGGFGVGYGAINLMGSPHPGFDGPTLPQGMNDVGQFIPVARIADMLLNPEAEYEYNGNRLSFPDIRFIYWAGPWRSSAPCPGRSSAPATL